MEELFLVLLILVLVMGAALAVMRGRAAAGTAGGRKPRGASGARRAPRPARAASYHLAPRNPDVMAGMLFELLSTRLNFNEMLAFAELVASPELTERYLDRLAASKAADEFVDQVAFLCRAMEAHAFGDTERIRVSKALAAKSRKERKLLEIQKNLDKIF